MLTTLLVDDTQAIKSPPKKKNTTKGTKGSSFGDLLDQYAKKEPTKKESSLPVADEKKNSNNQKNETKSDKLSQKNKNDINTEETKLPVSPSFATPLPSLAELPQKTVIFLRQSVSQMQSKENESISRLVDELKNEKDLKTLLVKAEKLGLNVVKMEVVKEVDKEENSTKVPLKTTEQSTDTKTTPHVLKVILARQSDTAALKEENPKLPTPLAVLLGNTAHKEQKEEKSASILVSHTALKEEKVIDTPLLTQLFTLNEPKEEKIHTKSKENKLLIKEEAKKEPLATSPLTTVVSDKPIEVSKDISLTTLLTQMGKNSDTTPKDKTPKGETSLVSLLNETKPKEVMNSALTLASLMQEEQTIIKKAVSTEEKPSIGTKITLGYDEALNRFDSDTGLLKFKTLQAKENLSRLSEDIKEQIDNYRPPLMKVSLEIRPENLGNVEVTLINRGNSLQVNVSSNNNALSMLAANVAEFKTNLVNMGFSEASMSFNFNQNGNGANTGQQNQERRERGRRTYESETVSEGSVTLESVDIFIPRYV